MGDEWKNAPRPGTFCTAIGWGALYEKGPSPDHLHEVSVPIISRCKSPMDNLGRSICAGEPGGGRDACQGDSGGPFLCRSERDSSEWYLAGIVSHGEGCARADEPGVYTRVSLYLEWIDSVVNGPLDPKQQSLGSCPGYTCMWGGERCISPKKRCDGRINCLGGEDEVDCVFEESVGAVVNETTVEPEMVTQMAARDPLQELTTENLNENLIEEDPVLPNVMENIPLMVTTPPTTTTTSTSTSTTTSTTTSTSTSTLPPTTLAPIDTPKILEEVLIPTTEKEFPALNVVIVEPSTTPQVTFDSPATTTSPPDPVPEPTATTITPPVQPGAESRGDFNANALPLEMFECKK